MDTANASNSASGNLAASDAIDPLVKVDALLDRFAHFGVELGLERIKRLLAALGNPQQQVPILHVAGSNGKGSVCAYLSSVLIEAGYRVGRYTSPHLVSWCERITLNGAEISATQLCELLQEVIAAIDPSQPSPTQFEVFTAAAWLYFARQQVDLAVMEVGLGGRLDATNVCDRPLVSIITPLSREHWQKLGPTLDKIAFEKAGILKAGCPAVIAPQPTEAEAVLRRRLVELTCPAVWVQPAVEIGNGWVTYPASDPTPQGELPAATAISYPLALLGEHQLTNSALAIATFRILQSQGWQITDAQIRDGMAKTQWAGRLQWMTWRDRQILIDGAHNPAGAAALRSFVDRNAAGQLVPPIHWVMGMIANKDHADVFRALLRPGDLLYLVPVPEHLPVSLEELAALAQAVCPELSHCQLYGDVIAGLEAANSGEAAIVLCGSLYLIGYFFKLTGDLGSRSGT
ncbi:bifunctional folylpolyglutamate synthase/dihydrofolate synthase [Phormidium tenue FACHB-886]|nr:bifunctional folylpolyglutamate synthase/dihydrofolate synthase [Phormidium tenue FACHB-886]